MCQQWLSIVGLCADIVGFLLIVIEWKIAWRVYLNDRRLEISEIRARYLSRMNGETRTEYEKDEDNYSMPKHMEQGLGEEIRYRTKVFYSGVALVVLGFAFQVGGSLPGGIRILNVTNCSTPWF
jgi:hypothetical protein